jgi:hypothetical protein
MNTDETRIKTKEGLALVLIRVSSVFIRGYCFEWLLTPFAQGRTQPPHRIAGLPRVRGGVAQQQPTATLALDAIARQRRRHDAHPRCRLCCLLVVTPLW